MWLLLQRSTPSVSHPYQPPRTVGIPLLKHHRLHRSNASGHFTALGSFPIWKGRPGLVFLAHRQEAQSHARAGGGRGSLTQPQPQTQPHLSLLGWVAWLHTQHCPCSRRDYPTVFESEGKQHRAPCLTSTDGEQEGGKPQEIHTSRSMYLKAALQSWDEDSTQTAGHHPHLRDTGKQS